MGALLAKFRKEKTTTEVLEQLEEKIQQIEKYTLNTQEQKKRFVGTFLAIAVGVYIIAFIVFYFVYLPETWKERFIYFVPLLIFPIVIILLRRLFTWYFQRKLNKNSSKLSELRAEKKKILEQVMDKETYKVAVNLLNRFGEKPSNSGRYSFGVTQRPNASPYLNNQATVRAPVRPTITTTAPPQQTSLRPTNSPLPLATQSVATSPALATTPQLRVGVELRRRLPFPIVNEREKGVFERCLDLLMGDGPQDRFALICNECHAHNGMAPKEDFYYIAFRCAFCNAMNPARKTRPVAPRLSLEAAAVAPGSPSLAPRIGSESSNSTSTSSDDDDDSEHARRRVQLRLSERIESNEDINHDGAPVTTDTSTDTVIKPSSVGDNQSEIDLAENVDNAPDFDKNEIQDVEMESPQLKKTN